MTIAIAFFDNVDEAVEYSQKMLYDVEEEENGMEDEGSEEDSDEEPEEPKKLEKPKRKYKKREKHPMPVKTKNGVRFVCPECKKEFVNKKWYNKHVKKCEGPKEKESKRLRPGKRKIKVIRAVEYANKHDITLKAAAEKLGFMLGGADYTTAKKHGWKGGRKKTYHQKKYFEDKEKNAFISKRTKELTEIGWDWDAAKKAAKEAWDQGKQGENI